MSSKPIELESAAKIIRGKPTLSLPKILLHLAIFTVLLLTDEWLFPSVQSLFEWIEKRVFSFDYFREMGHFYTTILACLLIWKILPSRRRAVPFIFGAVVFASLMMVIAKPLLARQRPNHSDGKTVFMVPFTSSSPSLPSGHATTAMANAHALSLVLPQAKPIFYALALGAGCSRVEQGRHFASDVYLGFIFGIFFTNAAALFWQRRADWLDVKLTPNVLRLKAAEEV
ncbi:MAG: phosphatase PAP2 family protein [Sumerlaeia bacterium]